MIVGIDPSQRHTGLCAWNPETDEKTFDQIDTGKSDLLTSLHLLRVGLRRFLWRMEPRPSLFGVERMVTGGQTSPLLFAVQMTVFEEILTHYADPGRDWPDTDSFKLPQFVHPYPVQLKSYMRKVHGVDVIAKSSIVQSFREEFDYGRISSHKVEAYYLARIAHDVVSGTWNFHQKSAGPKVFPWEIR